MPDKQIVLIVFCVILGNILSMNAQAIEIKDFTRQHTLHLSGTFQGDYRYISEDVRADNRFDIRRARLNVHGVFLKDLEYKLSSEFQGNITRRLVDAFGIYHISPDLKIQFGQFKVPFSREWLIDDSVFFFAERSIGFSLQPWRDIGLAISGELLEHLFSYQMGIFNGDGIDGSSRGNQKDDPEMALRFVVYPLARSNISDVSPFIGISFTESRIDTTNIQVQVKSTGMIGTQRNLYELKANTKFGALLDIKKRVRTCLEGGFIAGPVMQYFEYQRYQYKGLKPVVGETGTANFYSWHASLILNLNGAPILQKFSIKKNKPKDVWQLACRKEYFSGDANWMIPAAFNAAKEADGSSISLSWIRYPFYRILLDYTYTDFSDPLRVRINPDGSIDYIQSENSVILRFQVNF
jgi:phosphate-selective porin OprO/OprP